MAPKSAICGQNVATAVAYFAGTHQPASEKIVTISKATTANTAKMAQMHGAISVVPCSFRNLVPSAPTISNPSTTDPSGTPHSAMPIDVATKSKTFVRSWILPACCKKTTLAAYQQPQAPQGDTSHAAPEIQGLNQERLRKINSCVCSTWILDQGFQRQNMLDLLFQFGVRNDEKLKCCLFFRCNTDLRKHKRSNPARLHQRARRRGRASRKSSSRTSSDAKRAPISKGLFLIIIGWRLRPAALRGV